MKKLSFAIALLFMATVVSAQKTEKKAEKNESNKVEKTEKAAKQTDRTAEKKDEKSPLEFETLVIDFGDIQKSDKPVETVFRFKNTGKDPIILSNVRPSCGCTIPEWTKDPVLPKKIGEIKVQYKNTHIVGTFSKTISVTSNKNPDNPITLTIKGKVIDTQSAPEEDHSHDGHNHDGHSH